MGPELAELSSSASTQAFGIFLFNLHRGLIAFFIQTDSSFSQDKLKDNNRVCDTSEHRSKTTL